MKRILTFGLLILFSSEAWANNLGSFREPNKNEKIVNYGKSSKDELDKEIKLYVWNILTGVKGQWSKAFAHTAVNYDLVLIQETYFKKDYIKLFEDTKHYWNAANAYIHKETNIPSGVATGAFVKPVENTIVFTQAKEPIMNVKKVTLFSKYKIKGFKKLLLVINVHFINFVDDTVFAKELEEVEKRIKKHDGPIIFAGDFNTFSYPKQKHINNLTQKYALLEVSFKEDYRKKFLDNPLDHIYYRGFKVKSSEVIRSGPYSDHNLLLATLEIE